MIGRETACEAASQGGAPSRRCQSRALAGEGERSISHREASTDANAPVAWLRKAIRVLPSIVKFV